MAQRALLLLCILAGCASVDPTVFDRRLRTATFNAYVGAIEAQFGGLEAAGIEPGDLEDRYKERAVEAPDPAAFYRVLLELLADLDDPHAVLKVSPRFWDAPVGEPEWTQFVTSRGGVWMGIPRLSVRTPAQMQAALEGWLQPLGTDGLDALNGPDVAKLLRASSAYGDTSYGWHEPLTWVRLDRVDGVAIETPHDAELLMRGRLGSRVACEVHVEGQPRRIDLFRNAGVFEDEGDAGSVRRRLGPLELAALLEEGEEGAEARFHETRGRAPIASGRAKRRALSKSAFASGRQLTLRDPAAEAFGIEAWQLETPDGRDVAYLRIARFEPLPDSPLADVPSHKVGEDGRATAVIPRLAATLQHVFDAFAAAPGGGDRMIVDVAGNGGGSWVETGLLLSYFLPEDIEAIPHSVESVNDQQTLFVRLRNRNRQLLGRANVPHLTPSELIVLVDQGTASAGEITAETLRGMAGATIMGERTAGAEYSTAEFTGPDGSVLRIGLGGGMQPPLRSFQGIGIEPDVAVDAYVTEEQEFDLEAWRATYRFLLLAQALERMDRR